MNAEALAAALGGKKVGGGWIARCPSHHDREPSLSIRDADDGKVLVRCHAGCDQEQVIAALRSRGLWTENGRRRLTLKAPVNPQKMMLGPCLGGAVRLSGPGDILMVGEGIETCLAALRATGHPTWAALSTSGLKSLDLPEHVRDVMVLADGDEPGELAARNCAWRWKHEGRRVWIARPPYGKDFNDLLMGRVACVEEGAR